MRRFVEEALRLRDAGAAIPFAIVDRESGRAVGSTRYLCIEPVHRRLEIGFTWIAVAFQRTYVNAESKFALLQYAFETLGVRRVEFKVDSNNGKSRNALLRLGAREEGYFRKHMLYEDGRNRDSVYFSIVDDDWPSIEIRLQQRGALIEPLP
jgi:RimJ/RimL family protein N-acetyltransferase